MFEPAEPRTSSATPGLSQWSSDGYIRNGAAAGDGSMERCEEFGLHVGIGGIDSSEKPLEAHESAE